MKYQVRLRTDCAAGMGLQSDCHAMRIVSARLRKHPAVRRMRQPNGGFVGSPADDGAGGRK